VSFIDGSLEVVEVEVVSIWDSSFLVQSKNWSRIWGRSLSPGISSFLGINSGLSRSLGIGMG